MNSRGLKMTKEELKEILKLHKLWLDNDPKGVRSTLSRDALRGIDVSRAELRGYQLLIAKLIGFNVNFTSLTGSKHTIHYFKDINEVRIGCKVHPLEHWLKEYKNIGKEAKYSKEQITEYGRKLESLKNL
jgi:hypothetical protein